MDIPAEAATSALSPGVTRHRETRAGVEPEEDNEEPGSLTGEEEPVRRRAGPLTAEKAAYNRARPGKRERAQLREQGVAQREQRKGSKNKGKGPKGKPKGRGKAIGQPDYWRGWSWWQDYEDDWRGRPWHREAASHGPSWEEDSREASSSRRRQRSRSRRATGRRRKEETSKKKSTKAQASKPSPHKKCDSTGSEEVLAAAPKRKLAAKSSLKKKAGEGKPGRELNPGDMEAGAPDTEAVRPQLLRAEIEVAPEGAPDLLKAPGVETRHEDQSEPGANQAQAEAMGVKEEIPEEHPTPSLEVDWSEPVTIRAVATSKRYPTLVMRLPDEMMVEVKETSGRFSTWACPMVGTGKAPSKEPRFVIVAPTDHKKAWKVGSTKAHGLEPFFAFHASSYLTTGSAEDGRRSRSSPLSEKRLCRTPWRSWSQSSSATGEMTQRLHGLPWLECPDSRKSGICLLTISAEGGSRAVTSDRS